MSGQRSTNNEVLFPARMYAPPLSTPINAITHAPMVRFVVPFALGIALAFVQPLRPLHGILALTIVTAALGAVLLFPTLRVSRWQRGCLLIVWCMVFGLFWRSVRARNRESLSASGVSVAWVITALISTKTNEPAQRIGKFFDRWVSF